MAMKIAVLEDNADRQAVMRACLADRFHQYELHFFDASREMIRFLETHLNDTIAIALDHDLELKPGANGKCIDPGTGVDVAEFLATKAPVCTVVIHTTNTDGGAAMERVLRAAHWSTRRVIPFDDMNWIESDWFPVLRRAIVGPLRQGAAPKSRT